MQLEKVWAHAQDNHLDRERVMMTNVVLAVELCLKAAATHAAHRESGEFKFRASHDIAELYHALPAALRGEIATESEAFARQYVAYRSKVEAAVRSVFNRRFLSAPPIHPVRCEQAQAEWSGLAKLIGESSYTAFVNSTDPGVDDKYLHEGWLEEALSEVKRAGNPGDISQYFRYAPHEEKDELPTDLIHWVLMLGRFMYEHLFPAPPPNDSGPHTGFPTSA